MAVRLMNGGSAIFRCCAVSPPPTALRCCLRHHNHVQLHSSTCFSISRRLRCHRISFGYEAVRRYSAQSLVDMVMEELESLRKRGVARSSNKDMRQAASSCGTDVYILLFIPPPTIKSCQKIFGWSYQVS